MAGLLGGRCLLNDLVDQWLMHRLSAAVINAGLSPVSRLLLGSCAGLFAVIMFFAAPPGDKALYSYLFGGFCLAVCVACMVRGRKRQLVGSVIGTAVFLIALGYVVAQVANGSVWSGARSEPSLVNAILFFVGFGMPGVAYALKARFGLKRAKGR